MTTVVDLSRNNLLDSAVVDFSARVVAFGLNGRKGVRSLDDQVGSLVASSTQVRDTKTHVLEQANKELLELRPGHLIDVLDCHWARRRDRGVT
jgi:hypothetical protein